MRIFLAGATGVIGARLVPLLLAEGHEVCGLTRSAAKADSLRALGAEAAIVDVYDAPALRDTVVAFAPDAVMHQLTDLPDDVAQLRNGTAANARIRREGTANLIAAAQAARAGHFVAQSIAWTTPGEGESAVDVLERSVLAIGGVVVRYGQFYGRGTYYEHERPDPPRIQIDEAARRTLPALTAPTGILTVVEDEDP